MKIIEIPQMATAVDKIENVHDDGTSSKLSTTRDSDDNGKKCAFNEVVMECGKYSD